MNGRLLHLTRNYSLLRMVVGGILRGTIACYEWSLVASYEELLRMVVGGILRGTIACYEWSLVASYEEL